LGAAASAGASSITRATMPSGPYSTHTYDHRHIYAVGDVVRLGPSTHTSNIGATESVRVTALGSATFSIIPSLTYYYSNGDPLAGVGSLFPGEWGHANVDYSFFQNSIGAGIDDNYAFYCTKSSSPAINPIVYFSWQAVASNPGRQPFYIPSTYYRWGCYMKASALSGTIQLNNANLNASAVITLSQQASWTEVTDTRQSSSTAVFPNAYLYFDDTSTCTDLAIDHLFCSHAVGSADATSGIYTFDELPDFGSISVNIPNRIKVEVYNSGSLIGNSASGDDEKYEVVANFANASQTFVNELQNMKRWQDKGNRLLLKTHLPSFPPYLVGRMSMFGKKDSWDLNRSSFTFKFSEA